MERKELVDEISASGYDGAVSDADFWTAVGAELKAIRESAGWANAFALSQSVHRKPDHKTMEAIERGNVGQVKKLADYCGALRVSVRDVLASAAARSSLPSPRAMRVARSFDAMPAGWQRAVLAVLDASETPSAPPTTPSDGRPGSGRTRGGTDDGRKRKSKP